MRLKTTLLASAAGAAVLATVPVAQAGGSYISIFGGWNRPSNDIGALAGTGSTSFSTGVTVGPPTTPVTGTVTFNFNTTFFQSGAKARDGFVLGAAVGGDLSHWLKGLRGEVELAYRHSKFGRATAAAAATATPPTDTATFSGVTFTTTLAPLASASASGELRTFTLMANAWYDFDMGSNFTPYIGGGVGYADNELKHGLLADGSGGDFAWQLGAGVNYKIGDKTSIGLGYRYLDAGDIEVTLGSRLGGTSPVVSYDIESHSVLANINFQLGK
jgi:opacity protein-like surface antigen